MFIYQRWAKRKKRKHKRPRNTENTYHKKWDIYNKKPAQRKQTAKEKERRKKKFLWPCFMNEIFSQFYTNETFSMRALKLLLYVVLYSGLNFIHTIDMVSSRGLRCTHYSLPFRRFIFRLRRKRHLVKAQRTLAYEHRN